MKIQQKRYNTVEKNLMKQKKTLNIKTNLKNDEWVGGAKDDVLCLKTTL